MINPQSLYKSFYLIPLVGLLFLSACTLAGTPSVPTQTQTEIIPPTSSPTAIPTSTETPIPPIPTNTPMRLPVSPIPPGPRFDDLPLITAANVSSLSMIASLDLHEGDQITWSPSGNAFAISSPSGMSVYRLEAFAAPISLRYQSQPYFSADGTYLGARLENGDVQVWDLENGVLVGEYSGLRGEVVNIAFSPDLTRVAAASIDNQILVWKLASGEIVTRLVVPEWVVPITYTYDLLFSPDQSQLALFRQGEVLLWEVEGSEEPRRLHWEPPPASPVHGPDQFSPDWSAVAWSDRGNILIMDAFNGEQLNEFERQVGADFEFTRDWGSLVVIGYNDNVVSIWDPFGGEALQMLEHEETVFRFWLSPDERYLASLTFNGRAFLWDLTIGEALVEMTAEGESGDWLAFSPQGDQIALLMSDGRISFWDVPGAVEKFSVEGQATRTLLFSPDESLLLSATSDGRMRFIETVTGEQMLELPLGGAYQEASASFVYDGRLLSIVTGDLLQLWGAD